MLSKDVTVGDKIEITLRKDKARVVVHMSQVMDIIDDNNIVCAQPISAGHLVRLPLGSAYSFLVFNSNGMIRYKVNVLKLYKDGALNLMDVKIESQGEREQRREHFRLSRNLPIKFSVIEEDEDGVSAGSDMHEMSDGITKDISGGGIRLVSNQKLKNDVKLRCVLLIENETFIAIAKLLYTVNLQNTIYEYQYRVKFISVLPEEQERLIKYIFKEQRKQMSRENKKTSAR
jgi:c-di-GMP-binding flagellar brake protein YcgR